MESVLTINLLRSLFPKEFLVIDDYIFVKRDGIIGVFDETKKLANISCSVFPDTIKKFVKQHYDQSLVSCYNDSSSIPEEMVAKITRLCAQAEDNGDMYTGIHYNNNNEFVVVIESNIVFEGKVNSWSDIYDLLSILAEDKTLFFINMESINNYINRVYSRKAEPVAVDYADKFHYEDDDDDDYDDDEYEEDEDEYEEYEENIMGNDPKRKGDIMNDLKGTLRTAYSMNKNGMFNAATVTAGKALNKKACSLIDGMKGMPPAIKMITGSPFGEALVGNLIAIGLMSFTQDPRALTAANAMIQAGSFQLMENLKVEDFIESLLSGVKFNEVPAPAETVTLDIPTPKASGKKTAQPASE